MRKFIFGCVLMLCGVIGGTGWLIGRALLGGRLVIPFQYV